MAVDALLGNTQASSYMHSSSNNLRLRIPNQLDYLNLSKHSSTSIFILGRALLLGYKFEAMAPGQALIHTVSAGTIGCHPGEVYSN